MRVWENERDKVVDDGKEDTFKTCTSHRASALIPAHIWATVELCKLAEK